MGESFQIFYPFDLDSAISIYADDRAHLLQHIDQIHDFRFNGGASQLRNPFGLHSCQQGLFSGSD